MGNDVTNKVTSVGTAFASQGFSEPFVSLYTENDDGDGDPSKAIWSEFIVRSLS